MKKEGLTLPATPDSMRDVEPDIHPTPRYSISILALNGLAMTKACVEAVINHSADYELLLTDNGTSDGTGDYFAQLAKKCGNVTAIINAENQGFIKPNREALRRAKGEFMVFLNNDAIVPPGWLTMLEAEFYHDPAPAIVGTTGACDGFAPGAREFLGAPTGTREYVELSCAMARVSLLREVGLFSEQLIGAYAEDLDLSLRLRALGYTLGFAPFRVEHRRGASGHQVPQLREWQSHNHAFLMRRWGNYLRHRRLDLPIIIRRGGAIGDCLLTTPLIAQIKKENPRSEIYVETGCPDVFKDNPDVKGAAANWGNLCPWAHVINLDGAYENRPCVSIVDAYAQEAGYTVQDKQTKLVLTEKDERFGKEWIAIHAGPSHWPGKHWSTERFAAVAKWLRKREYKVLLVGETLLPIPHDAEVCGKATLQQTASAIAGCGLFIGIDSAPLHLAMSQGVSVLGLFGCTLPEIVLPHLNGVYAVCADSTVPCAGSRHRTTGQVFNQCSPACMESITVERVVAKLEEIL